MSTLHSSLCDLAADDVHGKAAMTQSVATSLIDRALLGTLTIDYCVPCLRKRAKEGGSGKPIESDKHSQSRLRTHRERDSPDLLDASPALPLG